MTEEEFLEKCNYAPWTLEEVAGCAANVTDNAGLSEAAKQYLKWADDLFDELHDIGYEFG